MNSLANTQIEEKPNIIITDSKEEGDGTKTINYLCNPKALELCAKELEKEITELTPDDIHQFVSFNIGSALKGHNEWKMVKKKVD